MGAETKIQWTDYLSVPAAARRLGVSPRVLSRLIRQQAVRAYRVGGIERARYLLRPEWCDEYLAARTTGPPAPPVNRSRPRPQAPRTFAPRPARTARLEEL